MGQFVWKQLWRGRGSVCACVCACMYTCVLVRVCVCVCVTTGPALPLLSVGCPVPSNGVSSRVGNANTSFSVVSV